MKDEKCPHGIEIHKNCFFCVTVLLRDKGTIKKKFVDKADLESKKKCSGRAMRNPFLPSDYARSLGKKYAGGTHP